eukprot:scaffold33447_cov161-Skeletonema_dohrnii-CCMP3373.AAC.2
MILSRSNEERKAIPRHVRSRAVIDCKDVRYWLSMGSGAFSGHRAEDVPADMKLSRRRAQNDPKTREKH